MGAKSKIIAGLEDALEYARTGSRARTTIAALIEEGDLCPVCFTEPVIFNSDGSCTCSTSPHPPCGACENSYLGCPSCGWRQDDEEADQ